jgi:hypothetical protein
VASLEITCGEYQARCGCCKTSRNTPEPVLPRAPYDNKVRDPVLGRLIDDAMSIEQTLKPLRRESLLELSTGFVYDLPRDHARRLDLAEHRRRVLAPFSGTLCVEELHLGRSTLLLATDPLADGCSMRPRASIKRAAVAPRWCATRRFKPSRSWPRRCSNWTPRSSPS